MSRHWRAGYILFVAMKCTMRTGRRAVTIFVFEDSTLAVILDQQRRVNLQTSNTDPDLIRHEVNPQQNQTEQTKRSKPSPRPFIPKTQNFFHLNCIAIATTGNTLTNSPNPAYAGGILALGNAPAASKIAKRL